MFSGLYDDCHVKCFSLGAFFNREIVTGGAEIIAAYLSCDTVTIPAFSLFLQDVGIVGTAGDLAVSALPVSINDMTTTV